VPFTLPTPEQGRPRDAALPCGAPRRWRPEAGDLVVWKSDNSLIRWDMLIMIQAFEGVTKDIGFKAASE
jgi:hypothetical protein